ncbi:glycosyltransferase family 2 protein [Miltoncostaea marina]|uniref:glycosyltransferase family 2 protein n=1 Tax=Miltoncostaea marina TaxID=2843215 RepID=UPI001C3D6E0B|nr:glycosyltransferase [Miltoncostaea marina]
MTRASVVIPVYERADLLAPCLDALVAAGLEGVELVLVDNASSDPAMAPLLRAWEDDARVVRNPANLGFARACNQGAELAAAPVVVFLNADTEVRPGWLEPLLDAVEDPSVGVAGSRLLYPDGRVQHAGMALMPGGVPVHLHRGVPGDHPVAARSRDLLMVTAACWAMRRDVVAAAGGFDADYVNGFEDVDLCLRLARRGLRARYRGDSVVVHHESQSPGRADGETANARLFRRRWLGWPADWEERLAEDGLEDVDVADCAWSGPLLGEDEAGAAGMAALRALADEGLRPLAREAGRPALAPGAAERCEPWLLAALNRQFVRVPAAERFEHPAPAVTRPRARRPGIGWWGPLAGRSGYAAAGRGLLDAAALAGVPVRAMVADAPAPGMAPVALSLPAQDFVPATWVVHHIPVLNDGARVWDEVAVGLEVPVVGATCFETAGLPASWVEATTSGAVREVWVPTRFNLRTFTDAGVDPGLLRVVPYPVDGAMLAPRQPAAPGRTGVTFLSVFEWTWRKGWDVLLRAWAEEFDGAEDVRLRVLTYRGAGAAGDGDILGQAAGLLRELGHDPERVADIDLVLEPVPHGGMPALYDAADAFVLPTRGEGAGMPVLEAAARGLPVIATAWGGHEELMAPETAFPVAVARMVEAPPELVRDNPVYAGQLLAEPDLASLRAAMRAVVEDRAEAARRAAAGRELVAERFSPVAAARALGARAEALVGGAPRALAVAR